MITLLEKCTVYNKGWVQRGGKLTSYVCPFCLLGVATPQPNKSQVTSKGYWDSAKSCPHCENLSFVKVWPSGRIKVITLP